MAKGRLWALRAAEPEPPRALGVPEQGEGKSGALVAFQSIPHHHYPGPWTALP